MNIAVDVRSIMYGQYTGIGEYTYQLLEHLFARDKTNHYVLFCNSQKPATLPDWASRYPNVSQTVFHYPNKWLHGSMLAFGRPNLQKMIEKQAGVKIDRIFMPNQNFVTYTEGTKLIVTVHDLSFVRFPEFFTPFHRFWHRAVNLKKLCQRAHRIISVSQHTARDLQELWGLSPEKITVIPLGLDPIFQQQGSGVLPHDLPKDYLLFLGTLEPRKNVEFVIDLFDAVAKQHPNLHLVLAGGWGWETEGIKQRLKDSPNRDRIKLLGYVDRVQKPALYRHAKAFVFPSFYEGFGLPPLEAMSQGCPVLTSNHSSLPEMVQDGAVTLPVTDLAPWVEALQEILGHRESFQPIMNRAKAIAATYTWDRAADTTLRLLTQD